MSNKACSDEGIARCPACGTEVWIHEVEFIDGDTWFTPRCSECNVAWAENYPTYEDAVAAWNKAWNEVPLGKLFVGRMVEKFNCSSLVRDMISLFRTIELGSDKNCFTCCRMSKQCPSPFSDCEEDCSETHCECRGCSTEHGLLKWRWKYADQCDALKARIAEIT